MDCKKPYLKNSSPYSKRNSPFLKASSPFSKEVSPYSRIDDVYSCYNLRLLLLENGTNLLLESGATIAL